MGRDTGITVLIVNWNGREDLAACLRSLAGQTDRDFQTLVVDNGSKDGSLALLRSEFPWVKVVEAGDNLGFAEGCNRGVAVIETPWVATLNNDTLADERWIEELRRAAREADPRVGMLQSRLVFTHDPLRTNSTGVLLYSSGHAEDRDFDAPFRDGDVDEEVFCATAGAALYRRSMLEQTRLPTGYFDRTFFMYFEDVDLGWRCRLAGWSARYVPAAIVRHAFQASSSKQKAHFVGLHLRRNRLRMLLKNGSPSLLARTLPWTVYGLVEAVVWKGPAVLPGFVTAIRDGLAQRRLVSHLSRDDRRRTEQRWVSRAPRSLVREIAGEIRRALS